MKETKKINSQQIGVFIDNDKLDAHISTLRDRGINIFYIKSDENLNDFDCLLIDIHYPSKMGFAMLDKVESNSSLSQLNIILIVKNILDWERVTFIQHNRIFDFLNINTEFEVFYEKLKSTLDFENLPRRKMSKNTTVEIDGVITHISESGAIISSPVLFFKNNLIEMESHFFDEVIDGNKPIFNVSKNITSAEGLFLSEIDFLNLNNESRLKLRKALHGWGVK